MRGRRAVDEFRRTYQACIPCRQRKAKCVATESREACQRCQMKHLACQYPTKQPWKRADDGERIHTQPAQNPAGNASGDSGSHPQPQTPDLDVTKVWNACRFVCMGRITAREALLLVDQFFSSIAPQSPVLTSFYAAPGSHYWLITQEPMLCCVILLISSQFHHPPGIGGKSRGYFIHHRLFQHCQHLILRIMLGQEKLSKAKTRHIGTIEALLLLSEWCPQSLHFPPRTGWLGCGFVSDHAG